MLIGMGFQKRLLQQKRGMTQFLTNQLRAGVKSSMPKIMSRIMGSGAMKMDDLEGGRVGQRRIMPLKKKILVVHINERLES